MSKKLPLILSLYLAVVFFVSLASSPPSKAASDAAGKLHRLDFRLEKASCATCILKVRKAVRETAGIAACDIALRKPYGGVIIYDPAKVTIDKMKYVALQADPHKRVVMVDLLDAPISKVPALLIPKYTALKSSP